MLLSCPRSWMLYTPASRRLSMLFKRNNQILLFFCKCDRLLTAIAKLRLQRWPQLRHDSYEFIQLWLWISKKLFIHWYKYSGLDEYLCWFRRVLVMQIVIYRLSRYCLQDFFLRTKDKRKETRSGLHGWNALPVRWLGWELPNSRNWESSEM